MWLRGVALLERQDLDLRRVDHAWLGERVGDGPGDVLGRKRLDLVEVGLALGKAWIMGVSTRPGSIWVTRTP